MSGRRCTVCKRLCIGHHGPTGSVCALKILTDIELQEDIDAGQLEGEKSDVTGGLSMTDKKLDRISSELDKLVSIVGSLAVRVQSNEGKLATSVAGVQTSRVREERRLSGVEVVNRSLLPPSDPPRAPQIPVVPASSSIPTTQSLSRDRELSRLLDQYNADESSGDLLRVQDRVNSCVGDQGASGEQKLKKVYQIPDYITSCDGLAQEDEDFELLATKGRSFKLQGQRKRPEPKDVTIPQWLSANLVILELLLPTLTSNEVLGYYTYTRQIGDFLQIYTSASVFMLDADHRKDVARGNRRWDEISSHYVHYYLSNARLRGSGGNAGSNTSDSGSSGGKKEKSRFNHPCARFNTREGCSNESCKFKPICSVSGCRGNHPAYEHVYADSFRKNKEGSEGGS
jgi:hypothetical protein